MKRIIIEYYCDLCEVEITTTSEEGLPQVTVQAVKEKQPYIRTMPIHMCDGCLETYLNRLPLRYDEGNNRPVWKDNHR